MSNRKPKTETTAGSDGINRKKTIDTEDIAERKIEIIHTDDPSMDDTLLEEIESISLEDD